MSQFNLKAAVQGSEHEPLLPVEKKLIGISLGIGVTLLVILLVINFFGLL